MKEEWSATSRLSPANASTVEADAINPVASMFIVAGERLDRKSVV